MIRNQNQAKGVTTTATRNVTRSARGRVFFGLRGETAATDTITTARGSATTRLQGEPVHEGKIA